jgi:hypothetical protein
MAINKNPTARRRVGKKKAEPQVGIFWLVGGDLLFETPATNTSQAGAD